MGTSTSPVFFTLPTSEKTLVPLLFSVPSEANQSAPLRMIWGMLAQVSTLFNSDGFPLSPLSTVWMYFALGSPTRPSSEAIRAVDSPQTNAPPPRLMRMSKLNSLPKIFWPKSPRSRAAWMASDRCSTAIGYSLRT